jgi:hypothetical protein
MMTTLTPIEVIAQNNKGLVMILLVLVKELDRKGAMSKSEFSQRLAALISEVEAGAPKKFVGAPRLDLVIARNFVKALEMP